MPNKKKFVDNEGVNVLKEYIDTAKEQAMSITSGGRSNIGTPTETGYMRIKDGDHAGTEQINLMYNLATSDNTLSLMYETSGDFEHDREFIIPTTDYVDSSISSISANTDNTLVGYEAPASGYSSTYYQTNLKGSQNQRMVVSLLESPGEEELSVNIVDTDKGVNKSIATLPKDKIATKTELGDLTTLTTTDKTSAVAAINELKFDVDGLGEPYRLKDFSQTFTTALTIPSVTQDVSNTSIPNVDITITGQEATDFAIAGLLKYEVFDASNNRLNCFPVCSFSMDGQKTLRVRMMVGGPNSKSAKKISGAILLKHR